MMDSTLKFTGKADGYAKYRPSYAEEFIDHLIASNHLTEKSTIADIGAGTGILTRQLLERGLHVFAVEPNGDMRKAAGQQLGAYPGCRLIAGTAEDTTLEYESVDLVVAAQAFHWFDREKFRVECRRVLRPGAKVVLVWNSRDESDHVVMEIEGINMWYCPTYIGPSGGIEAQPAVFDRFFANGKFEVREFRNDARYDLESFIGRILSGSYAPREGDGNYKPYVEALEKLFNRFCEDNILVVPSFTRSYEGNV